MSGCPVVPMIGDGDVRVPIIGVEMSGCPAVPMMGGFSVRVPSGAHIRDGNVRVPSGAHDWGWRYRGAHYWEWRCQGAQRCP